MGFFDKLFLPRQIKDFYTVRKAIEDGLSGRLKLAAIIFGDAIEEDFEDIEGDDPLREMFINTCRRCGLLLHVTACYKQEAENYLKSIEEMPPENRTAAIQFYILITMLQTLLGFPRDLIAEELGRFEKEHDVEAANCGLSADEINLILAPIQMKIMHLRYR